MVKIQDGCHRFCSYCIVPYLRGLPVSRSTGDIVKQVNRYAARMKEVVLTAINTEAFGRDTGESLIGLISRILSETPIRRLSFGSIHPWSITDEFLRYYATVRDNSRFSSFFHVPLQSGSNKMLSLMKREYTREEIDLKLRQIASTNPHALIATDVIVGFLEETQKDFEDTLAFLEQSPFTRFHIFRFSSRNNTAAHYMRKRLWEPTAGEKKARASALQKLHMRKMHAFLERQIGWISEALYIGVPENGFQKAILNNQLIACIPVKENLSGSMKRVTITELKNGILYGKSV
jgi:threonylcarbamoyladenosine tRNA methylthiotransferase MtaB